MAAFPTVTSVIKDPNAEYPLFVEAATTRLMSRHRIPSADRVRMVMALVARDVDAICELRTKYEDALVARKHRATNTRFLFDDVALQMEDVAVIATHALRHLEQIKLQEGGRNGGV